MTLAGARIAVYARYSSDKQSESSIEDQVARCRAFVRGRGGDVVDELVFTDYAVSGASLVRPGFEAMMRAVDARLVDVVVTEDASRISRDLGDASTVFKRLAFRGVQLFGVADGVDTTAKNAKLTYAVKSLVNDLYLDDLRDKTLRGMQGRARAGLATGGLPYGYRSVPLDAGGRAIEVDEARADVVRRIFGEYGAGKSCAAIATALNDEGVEPPRASAKRRRPGWVASAVRAMLLNPKYSGTWRFGARQWRKVPGTNRRLPIAREAADVVELDRPELRIVEAELWRAVVARFAATAPGERRARGASPRGAGQRQYLLSGLLRCAHCGAVMSIHGGDRNRRYYGCADARGRGTCSNRLSIREDLVRTRVLGAIRDRFSTSTALAELRELAGEVLAGADRVTARERVTLEKRLEREERRVRGLIELQADGDRSPHVAELRRELEGKVAVDRARLATLRARRLPKLPTPHELVGIALALDELVEADVATGREQLEQLLDGPISLEATGDSYVARLGILPLAALELRTPPLEGRRSFTSGGCGGRI